ncbi:hypothetical protein AVEN_108554-1 [Araneus ventricosus]|uniref:Uncharacterized protein n=1 Tax=Araneus ventricosus TaxID=182803 RepID=A0A4Y2TQM7_ARAVE|nr:hypothetical protein AVEN_108554-1 [Araneus ventricosus]
MEPSHTLGQSPHQVAGNESSLDKASKSSKRQTIGDIHLGDTRKVANINSAPPPQRVAGQLEGRQCRKERCPLLDSQRSLIRPGQSVLQILQDKHRTKEVKSLLSFLFLHQQDIFEQDPEDIS